METSTGAGSTSNDSNSSVTTLWSSRKLTDDNVVFFVELGRAFYMWQKSTGPPENTTFYVYSYWSSVEIRMLKTVLKYAKVGIIAQQYAGVRLGTRPSVRAVTLTTSTLP